MKTLLSTLIAFTLAAQTKEAKPNPAPNSTQPALGPVIGDHVRACVSGDTSPAGTVVNGYTKVIEPTPFGQACRWVQNPK